jgi:hypothetical protein
MSLPRRISTLSILPIRDGLLGRSLLLLPRHSLVDMVFRNLRGWMLRGMVLLVNSVSVYDDRGLTDPLVR